MLCMFNVYHVANTLKDEKIHIDNFIEQMAKKGMKVAGKWCFIVKVCLV